MTDATPRDDAAGGPPAALLTLIAIATGCLVANLYYAQPLVASIAADIGLSPDMAGAAVSVTQIGYGLGLFFLVSAADRFENKTQVLVSLSLTTLGLMGAALSSTAAPFFVAAFLIGLFATGAQVLIPFAAHLVPPERRGRTIGNIMAGLLTGIMLARPVSLFVAGAFGWRAVFFGSALLMVALGLALWRMMPRHHPQARLRYGQVLASMAGLLKANPAVRWRAIYQGLLFAAFNLFWTAAPMMLAERFGLDTAEIGLFALAGAGGALAAPLAGRLADRGHGTVATAAAMITVLLGFLAMAWVPGWNSAVAGLAALVVLAVVVDAAVQTNQIVGQRVVFSFGAEIRGRVNALYMTIIFAGGSLGSMLGTLTYHRGGWTGTALAGAALGAVTLAAFCVESWQLRRARRVEAEAAGE